MADERHIIDIILKARDDTAAALASATANVKAFERVTKDAERGNEAYKKSFAEVSREISVNQQKLGALTRQISDQKGVTAGTVEQVVKLEQATRGYVKALGDENASQAQRAQALQRALDAQRSLNKALAESTDLTEDHRQALVKDITETQKAIAQAQELRRVQGDIARERKQQLDEENRAAAERNRARQEEFTLQQRLAEMESRDHDQRVRDYEEGEERRQRALQETADLQAALHAMEMRDFDERGRRAVEDIENEERRRRKIEEVQDTEASRWRQGRRDAQAYMDTIQNLSRLEGEREAARQRGDFITKARVEIDAQQARMDAEKIAVELQGLLSHIEANVDLDAGEATAEAVAIRELLGSILKDFHLNVELDLDDASVARVNAMAAALDGVGNSGRNSGRDMNFLRGALNSVVEGFDASSGRIASFDNFLRGLMSLGIAIFFQQLFLLASAAAGGLAALASSAAYAGAAIGGALTAGIAQAIPVLGIFAAALQRVKTVINAVQQANLLQQQQSYQGAQQARQQVNAADQVRSAQERLADSHRRVAQAQKNVDEARQRGIDKLLELIDAERGLMLTLDESEAAIRRAAARGDTAALPRAFLRRDTARRDLANTREEIAQRTAAGPERSPEVLQANEQLKDAQRAAHDAERGLQRAKRSADEAAAGVTAAAGKLDFLLGQMSDAERRLYGAILRLQNVWRGFAQTVTAPLINAFTDAINKIITLLQDPRIINAARGLASEMATQFRRIFSAFTSDAAIGQILRIVKQARDNLAPLTTIAINIGKAFLDIAEAAGPALSEILGWVRDISKRVADFFDTGRKSGALTDFFKKGVDHLKAWGDLLWQIIRLFAAIAGPGGGARTGLGLLREITGTIRGWADEINDTDSKTSRFFRRFFNLSKQMIEAMAPVFRSIAREFDKTFSKDGLSAVEGFATFLADVLIPAIGKFARFVGGVTADIGKFTRAHPQVARMAAAFLAGAFAVSTMARAFTILGPITKPLGFIAKSLFDTEKAGKLAAGVGGRLASAFGRFGEILVRLFPSLRIVASIGLGPWLAIAGAIVFLLIKLHLLDDLFRAFGKFFTAFWEQLRPPLERARATFQKLADAASHGRGVFALLTPVLKALITVLGFFLEGIGRSIGKVLGGIIDVISGFVEFVVDILSGDFSGAWDAVKRMISGVGRAIIGIIELLLLRGVGRLFTGIIRGAVAFGRSFVRILLDAGREAIPAILRFLVRLPGRVLGILRDAIRAVREDGIPGLARIFGRLASSVWDAVSSGFGRVIRFFRDLPGRLFDFVKGIPGKLAGAFKGVGGDILDAMFAGITNVAGVAKDIMNSLIDLINEALPDKIHIPGPAPDIPLPDNPIPKLASGGRVGTGFGGGDRRLILAEDGEWVIRKEAVATFGDAFMARLNMGRGGGRGGRYAEGGKVEGGNAAIVVDFTGDMADFVKGWGQTWNQLVTIARRGANMLTVTMRDLDERIGRVVRHTWTDLVDVTDRQSRRLVRMFRETFADVQQIVFAGFRYVGNATNESLKAFDADPINLTLRRPTGHAGGGWAGRPGERGADAIPTWLGRGEAVLNWAHQKVVNSALWNQYGTTLEGLFKNTNALHGGTHGQTGYASGGYTGPGHSGAGFTPMWNFAKKKFGMTYFTGYDGHNKMTSSGNVSDHWYHRALDMGNGVLTQGEDALNAFIKTKIPQVVKQLIWRDQDQFTGYPIGGHTDHVHLAMLDQFAFNSSIMARILSRASRGLSIADLLKNATGGNLDVDHVQRAIVKGIGPLRDFSQKAIDKVRRAANNAIDKAAAILLPGQDARGLHGEPYDGPLNHAFPQHSLQNAAGHVQLSPDQVYKLATQAGLPGRTFEQIAHGESQYYPGVVSSDGGWGLWQMTPRVWGAPAIAHMNSLGGLQAMLNPWKNALMAKYLYDSSGISPWFGTQYLTSRVPQFAAGGQVPGGPGQPVPIVAHAGEWVVNQIQQSKLARLLGMGIGQLRDLLGFRGGPTHYQGGGDVRFGHATNKGVYEAPAVDPTYLAGIEREINTIFKAISNIGRRGKLGSQLDKFFKAIRNLTDQDGGLDQMGAAIERLGNRLDTNLALAQVGLKRVGDRLVRRVRGMLDDPVEIAQRTMDNLDRIRDALRAERRVAQRGLRRTEAQLDRLRRGGVTEKEQDRFVELMGARTKFIDTMNDVDSKIAENRKARYEARLERLQANLAREQRGIDVENQNIDLSGRLADLQERAGDRLGAARSRVANSDRRTTNLGAERDMVTKFLARATKLGDTDTMNELTDRLADLNVAIQEEAQTRKDLVATYRSTATDIITGRAERSTGLIGSAQAIMQRLGEISGNLNLDAMRGFLSQIGAELQRSAGEIAKNVRDAADEFSPQGNSVLAQLATAFQGGPESFATKLAALGPTIALLESTMSEAQRTAFQALIDSMINNTTAVVENTGAIADLNGSVTQQFTTTAWQWFREAVFSGMGNVLPQYDVPQMQTGGHVTRGGLFKLHTGEFVVNADRSNVPEGDTNITIYEAGRPLDVTHLASRLAFEKKSRRR